MREKGLVICPVYNERATIADFYRHLRTWYSQDVLFIDDGSTDGSGDFCAEAQGARTFLLRHPTRKGYGAALRSGFKFSLGEGYARIVTIDVDLQHDPEYLPRLFRGLEQEEVVLGSRYMIQKDVGHVPQSRLSINRYISGLIHRLFSVRFTDPFCGLRGYRDSFLKGCSHS
ncbi:MAG: glycosyltransferase family 2 protein [bacterium]